MRSVLFGRLPWAIKSIRAQASSAPLWNDSADRNLDTIPSPTFSDGAGGDYEVGEIVAGGVRLLPGVFLCDVARECALQSAVGPSFPCHCFTRGANGG
jgi:hypothetical protein